MTKVAKRIEAVAVVQEWTYGSERGLVVSCPDYDAYEALPAAVELDGQAYGKTGWDSDKGVAFYKTSARIARAV